MGRYMHHTQQTTETSIHAVNGFRNRNPRSRTTADLRRRSHRLRDRPVLIYSMIFSEPR